MQEDLRDLIKNYPVRTIHADGTEEERETRVLSEHILTVLVNEVPAFSLTCTKEHLRELVTGRLFTERIISSVDEIEKIYFCKYENEASVFLNKEIEWEEAGVSLRDDKEGPEEETASTMQEQFYVEPTCCTNNRTFLRRRKKAPLKPLPEASFEYDWIFDLARAFSKGTRLHSLTQGTHSCFLQREGKILFCCEDIGRHNALDKAIGYGLHNNIALSECILFTSGRVPVDMVEKVIVAGVPVLVSKSVSTAESIELSKKYGLTIITRAWQDRFEMAE